MRFAVLLLFVSMLASGCAGRRGKWSFPCSYHVYNSLTTEHVAKTWSSATCQTAPVMLCLLAVPIAIDLVILPVTGVHDLCIE